MTTVSPSSSRRKKAEFGDCTRRLISHINKGERKSKFSFCPIHSRVKKGRMQMKFGSAKIECLPYRHRVETENAYMKRYKNHIKAINVIVIKAIYEKLFGSIQKFFTL